MIQLSFIEVNGRLLFKEQPYCSQRVNPKFHQYNHSFGIFWQSGSILAQATKLFSITWTHPVMPVKVWTEESQQSRLGSASSLLLRKHVLKKQPNERKQRNNQPGTTRFMWRHDPGWRAVTPLNYTDIMACEYSRSSRTAASSTEALHSPISHATPMDVSCLSTGLNALHTRQMHRLPGFWQ